ncbi:MAG: GNAT family N-acetyltransferase [Eubacteriaceae bacterium]|nr:GNAT family N-acetyltransferase [Eubacteriaceae bacterium]
MATRIFLQSTRITLETSNLRMAKEIADLYKNNYDHLREWEDIFVPEAFSAAYQKDTVKLERRRIENKTGIDLWIRKKSDGSLIGKVSVFGIIWGNFSTCIIGYKLDQDNVGFGYMSEAITRVEQFLFEDLNLHRIEINIMPKNERSLNVVKRLGYTYEGRISKYIFIGGDWQDHFRYTKTNKHWRIDFVQSVLP